MTKTTTRTSMASRDDSEWNDTHTLASHMAFLTARLEEHDIALANRMRKLLNRLKAEQSSVAYLGRFSSGKSSLINCALRRDLLPTSDLTETGVVCMLQHGQRDALIVHGEKDPSQRTVLNTASIMRHGSLRGESGEINTAIDTVKGLTIELVDFGQATKWFDTPGSAGGSESALADEAAQRADVTIWVLGTQAFLGESEAREIARHVNDCGPHGVVLAINVRTASSATPEEGWQKALGRVDGWKSRIADLWAEAGLDRHWTPPMVLVSAKEAFASPEAFGGPELRSLLDQTVSPQKPAIKGLRLRRAGWELGIIRSGLGEIQKAVRQKNRTARAALEEYNKTAADAKRRLERDLNRNLAEIRELLDNLTEHEVFKEMLDSVTPDSLQRDDRYSTALNKALEIVADELKLALLDCLEQARPESMAWGRGRATTVLHKSVVFRTTTVTVPNAAVAEAKVGLQGAVIGGFLGALAGPWGMAAGAALGRGLQRAQHHGAAVQADVDVTRAAILEQTRLVVAKLSDHLASSTFIESLSGTFSPTLKAPEGPDNTTESDLDGLVATMDSLLARLTAAGAAFPDLSARLK